MAGAATGGAQGFAVTLPGIDADEKRTGAEMTSGSLFLFECIGKGAGRPFKPHDGGPQMQRIRYRTVS